MARDLENLHSYLRRRISPNEPYENLLKFPRFFEIETVNACNARCPMCTIDEWERNTPTMRPALFEKIASEICAHADEVRRVSLYRDGEPLLDKRMPERIARLKTGGIKEVSISTNVALLDEKKARGILEGGIDRIILSIDSLKKEVFEAIRYKLVFEEVMENALRFISLRNTLRPSTVVWIRMIRQSSNYDEWPAFEEFWQSKLKPHDRVNFHNLHNWGGQLDKFAPIATSFEPTLPCVALWSLMVIFGDGKVPLCNVDYNNKFPTGDVATQSIEEVWQNGVMAERRRQHLAGDKQSISLCTDCNVWDEPPDMKQVAHEFGEAVEVATV